MFGTIGITEILVIAAVALVILGPDKFPSHAKIAMRFFRDIRGYWDEAKRDLAEELKPIKKEMKELEKYKPEDYLDSMTGDQPEDSNYDAQGYPYSPESAKKSVAETTGTDTAEAPAPDSGETPAAGSGVEGTKPYAPDKDYVDDSQRYPD